MTNRTLKAIVAAALIGVAALILPAPAEAGRGYYHHGHGHGGSGWGAGLVGFGIGAIVVVMAILASLQPAWKAARMDPNTALRHV